MSYKEGMTMEIQVPGRGYMEFQIKGDTIRDSSDVTWPLNTPHEEPWRECVRRLLKKFDEIARTTVVGELHLNDAQQDLYFTIWTQEVNEKTKQKRETYWVFGPDFEKFMREITQKAQRQLLRQIIEANHS